MGVDVGDRDRRARAEAGQRRRSFGQDTRSAAGRQESARHLLVDDVLEARVERGEVGVVGEPVPLRPHRLVAGGAGVAGLGSGQLPDDPVGGFDQPLRPVVELGRLVEDLERLCEEPLRRDLPAVAGEPRLLALCRDRVDAIGLRLSGVVLPELDPRVRLAAQLLEQAQRRAVGGRRQHRARGEVDADPDHLARVDAGLGEDPRNGVLERPQVVLRVLQRPVGFQPNVVVRLRQPFVDDTVCVRVRRALRAPVRPRSRPGPPAPTRCRSRRRPRMRRSSRGSPAAARRRPSTPACSLRLANASRPSASAYRSLTSALSSMRPFSARSIARGRSVAFIRRQSEIVSPLRRAVDAVKHERSSVGMPTSTSRPPGRNVSIAVAIASSSPATSNATSTPSELAAGRISVPARRVSTATVAPSASAASDAVRERIGCHEHVHARTPKQLDEQEAERAAAVHACRHAGSHMTEVERVQCDAEWLEQRRLGVGERVGQAMGEAFRPRQSRAQSAVDRVPGKPAGDAEVLVAGDARRARCRTGSRDRAQPAHPSARPFR